VPDAQHEGTESAEAAQPWSFGGERAAYAVMAGGRKNGKKAAEEAGVAGVVAVCAREVGTEA
jgi:hypothetical protein